MNLVTLDFETFFSDDYTLSKLTTEAYVRDPRFKVHCVGYLDDAAQLAGVTNGQVINPNAIENNAIIAHHAQFDGLILSHHYGVKPAFWFDTMAMAQYLFPHERHSLAALAARYGLAQKTVPYHLFKGVRDLPPDVYRQVADGCAHDVELTHAIFLKMLPQMPKDELRLIDLTVRMFTEPMLRLDRDVLTEYLRKTGEQKEDLLAACGATREDCGSAAKFAALLRACGVEPPVKISKKTKKEAYAFAKTDPGLKALLDHPDERVQALVEARLGIKSNMVETRAQRMLDMDTRGAMCVYLAYAKAHTLRWAGGDKMNWQNFKRGSVLRSALLAPLTKPRTVVVVIDAAQIECRLLNDFAGQADVLEKFRNKADIYSELATQFYGETVDKSQPDKRGVGKQIELSCGYRAGAETIKITARNGTYGPPVHLTDEQALAARDLYRRTHPMVVEAWKYADKVVLPALAVGQSSFMWSKVAIHKKQIILPGGACLDYSNLEMGHDEKGWKKFYTKTRAGLKNMHGGILIQNIMEGLARQIIAQAMLQIAPRYKIVTCTHDEIVYLAPEAEAQPALDFGLDLLKTAPAWCGAPLDAEGGYAGNYSK